MGSIRAALAEAMGSEYVLSDGTTWTAYEWVAYQLVSMITKGEMPFVTGRVDQVTARDVMYAIEQVANRIDGAPAQTIDVQADGPSWKAMLKTLSAEDLAKLEEIVKKTALVANA